MMKKAFLTTLILMASIVYIYACSAIVLKKNNQIFLAKNFDWTYREGVLIKNVRGTKKVAYFTHTGEQASWTSKYGSVTFNQNGLEMPYGGMNEKGLVIEMLWLETSQYNVNEEIKYVNELEWIQYQLDNYESVKEVMDHLPELKIYPIKGKVHYILTDNSGESMVIEYLNGKAMVHQKEANTCQAITNNSVPFSEYYKNDTKGFRKSNVISVYRYYQLEQQISNTENRTSIDQQLAFDMLQQVAIRKGAFKTMWSIVYDVNQRSISFFTDTHKKIKTIDLSTLDFDNNLVYFDLNQNKKINLGAELKILTEPVSFSYSSPSLIHLGLDETFTKDISRHQFSPNTSESSVFAANYFHFEISMITEKDGENAFIAIMENEDDFNSRKAVEGGYLYGKIGKGTIVLHIYGLKNGQYAMLTFIDENKNKKLDFDKTGKALEQYATFGRNNLTGESALTFENTSGEFNKDNAKVVVSWKE